MKFWALAIAFPHSCCVGDCTEVLCQKQQIPTCIISNLGGGKGMERGLGSASHCSSLCLTCKDLARQPEICLLKCFLMLCKEHLLAQNTDRTAQRSQEQLSPPWLIPLSINNGKLKAGLMDFRGENNLTPYFNVIFIACNWCVLINKVHLHPSIIGSHLHIFVCTNTSMHAHAKTLVQTVELLQQKPTNF